MPRILFLGESWFGSCARACAQSLRRLGCDVIELDVQTFLPRANSLSVRVGRKIAEGILAAEYNREIGNELKSWRPDFVLAFKGNYVDPSTLKEARNNDIRSYDFYPDTSVQDKNLRHSRGFYDILCARWVR